MPGVTNIDDLKAFIEKKIESLQDHQFRLEAELDDARNKCVEVEKQILKNEGAIDALQQQIVDLDDPENGFRPKSF